MASLASEISGTQMVEYFGRMGCAGGDAKMVAKFNGDDKLMERLVAWARQQPEFRLIHGIYTPNTEILPAYDAQCLASGVDLKKFWWEGSPNPLDFTDDPGDVVVLDSCFGSLEEEQRIVWAWLTRQLTQLQKKVWWWPELKTDAEHFRLQGNAPYPSWRRRWIRFSRTANYGRSPGSVLDEGRTMPGREILQMLAQHPEVALRMNGSKEHPFLWMAGLEATVPGDEQPLVPVAWFFAGDGEFRVDANDRGDVDPDYAVPAFPQE